jgi:hypothetical protein
MLYVSANEKAVSLNLHRYNEAHAEALALGAARVQAARAGLFSIYPSLAGDLNLDALEVRGWRRSIQLMTLELETAAWFRFQPTLAAI